jgi:hypothetical protein
MKDWIEDALGAVCLFAIGYGLMLLVCGIGG